MQAEYVESRGYISFIGLLKEFYRKKTFILLCSLLGLVIGWAVVFFSQPLYEAMIKLSAPDEGNIAPLNLGRTPTNTALPEITVSDAYYAFRLALLSDQVKNQFFNSFYQPVMQQEAKAPIPLAQLRKSFKTHFVLRENPRASGDRFISYTLAIRGYNPQQVAEWLKQYINLAQQQAIYDVVQKMQEQAAVLSNNLQHKIDIARSKAKMTRMDRITKLKEKLRLAEWEKMNDELLMDSSEPVPVNPQRLRVEIENLSQRKSDDAFIPDLRSLQAELQFYQSLKINTANVLMSHVDGTITTPTLPIAPQKNLLLMVYLSLGFLTGLMGVMLQILLRRSTQISRTH